MIHSKTIRRALVAVCGLLTASLWWPAAAAAAPAPRPAAPPSESVELSFSGLVDPMDVAVDGTGNVYVLDNSTPRRVVKRPADGSPQVTVGFTGTNDPRWIAADGSGNVYLSDHLNNRVLRMPANGGPQVVLPFTGLLQPEGVDVDSTGAVYVADRGNGRVVKLSPEGAQTTLPFVPNAGNGAGDVAVALDGTVNMVRGNSELVQLTPAGVETFRFLSADILRTFGPITFDETGVLYFILVDSFGDSTAAATLTPANQFAFSAEINNNPRAIDIDDAGSIVWIGDGGVFRLPSTKGAQTTIATTGLDTPIGTAVDAAGNIFVADQNNNRIVKVPAAGGAQVTLPFTGLNLPRGVAVNDAGDVLVTDTGNNRVLKLAGGVGVQTVLPFTGLSGPFGLAVDGAGSVFVADTNNNRILKLTSGGAQSTLAFTGLSSPFGVTVDRFGNAFAADSLNNRVLRLTPGGVQTAASGFDFPFFLASNSDGDVFVADTFHDRIAMIPADTDRVIPVDINGLVDPYGVAIDRAGNLFATDSGNSRVVKLKLELPELRVTTSPALPAQIFVDGVARDSWGINWARFPVGTHQVCFEPVPGYTTPACQSVTMSLGATSTVVGTYTPKGYLRVITSPALPSTITVAGVARNDWGLWTEMAPGTYSVCFGNVAGFNVPSCRDVAVTAGTTATTTGTFTANASAPGPAGAFGYLRAVTNPATNALITVDGIDRNTWGLDWLKVPTGTHQVCFGSASGLTAPPCQDYQFNNGGTVVATGTYAPQGFLRVLTSPALPATIRVNGAIANAYGMWTSKAPGSYEVCFGPVAGYVTPPCQTGVSVTAGNNTTLTGTYIPLS